MKILADENLNALFIEDLRTQGYQVLSIRETSFGIPDTDVAVLAGDQDSILITEDKDFGELIFAHKAVKISVVFLRYRKEELQLVRKQILQVLQLYHDRSGHFFFTISRGKIRVTEL